MNRLTAALAYAPQGVICGRCKVRKPPADYSRSGAWCRACCQHYAHERRSEAALAHGGWYCPACTYRGPDRAALAQHRAGGRCHDV